MEEYEGILLVKPEVFVYKIPPRATNRGYRAADWKLDAPDFTGRLRVVNKGKDCTVKIEDKNTGELFAKCPIDKYPGVAVESVTDSSRYFVLRIQDDNGRSAFIGIGFADRSDSFDMNVALQDHFKWVQKSEELEHESVQEDKPHLDLSFKEGQTIKINMNIAKKNGTSKSRPKPSSASGSSIPGLLPPPPGGLKMPPSPSTAKTTQDQISPMSSTPPTQPTSGQGSTLLLDFDSLSSGSSEQVSNKPPPPTSSGGELWGDFTSASGDAENQSGSGATPKQTSWIQF